MTEDGKAMTFGRNPHGQLGLDNIISQTTPQIVPALENMNIIGAACGRHHTLFLTDSGTVYACGDNRSGQCGVGNQQPQILTPTRINYRGPPIIKVNFLPSTISFFFLFCSTLFSSMYMQIVIAETCMFYSFLRST